MRRTHPKTLCNVRDPTQQITHIKIRPVCVRTIEHHTIKSVSAACCHSAHATQFLVRCGCAFSAQRRARGSMSVARSASSMSVARSASSWEDAFGA
eukprot:1200792-Prymnesium_polylepis.1